MDLPTLQCQDCKGLLDINKNTLVTCRQCDTNYICNNCVELRFNKMVRNHRLSNKIGLCRDCRLVLCNNCKVKKVIWGECNDCFKKKLVPNECLL